MALGVTGYGLDKLTTRTLPGDDADEFVRGGKSLCSSDHTRSVAARISCIWFTVRLVAMRERLVRNSLTKTNEIATSVARLSPADIHDKRRDDVCCLLV